MPTPSHDRLVAVFAVLVVVALLPAVGTVPVAGATQTAEQPSFSSAHFEITVYADGSARWTFRYQTPLENESERQHFREFARHFEQNRTDLYTNFKRKATSLVEEGENVTGRPMDARNFSRRAYVTGLDDNLGVVEMSFTWTNFARTTGERVIVGDLFEGGLYLGPNQRIVFETGPSLQFESVTPDPAAMSGPTLAQSDSVTWTGQREFTDEHPRLVFVNESAGTTAGNTETNRDTTNGSERMDGLTDGGPTTTSESSSGSNVWLWMAVGMFLSGALVTGVWFWRRGGDVTMLPDPTTDGESADTAGAESESAGDGGEAVASTPAVTEEEMLTDEERVRRLLEDHGGRMRQVNIVEETDWSKSKVSMLLSEMEEEGEISRLRVGRENVVALPGQEPEMSGQRDEDADRDDGEDEN